MRICKKNIQAKDRKFISFEKNANLIQNLSSNHSVNMGVVEI